MPTAVEILRRLEEITDELETARLEGIPRLQAEGLALISQLDKKLRAASRPPRTPA